MEEDNKTSCAVCESPDTEVCYCNSIPYRKRVLIITPFYPPNIGGAETFAEALAEKVSETCDVMVLTYQPFRGNAPAVVMKKSGMVIRRLHWAWTPPAVWKGVGIMQFLLVFPKLRMEARMLMKHNQYDVVHTMGLIGACVGAVLKWKNHSCKVYATMLALYNKKGISGRVLSGVVAFILNKMDKVFVEGEGGKENLLTFGVNANKIIKFQHWVDQKVFKPALRTYGKYITVLFVGRPIPEKGIDFLYAIKKLAKDDPIQFDIVTDLPYDKLVAEYQKADILIVPSAYAEGFVRVIAEAASCGCVILSSDKGSLPELVEGLGAYFPLRPRLFYSYIQAHEQNRAGLKAKQNLTVTMARNKFSEQNAGVILNEY